MTEKDNTTPTFIKDSDNDKERDYILQDNKKTKFGATFIIVVLVLLVLAVVGTSMFITWE